MARPLPSSFDYNETSGNTVLDGMCEVSEDMRISGALVLERWLRQEEPELVNVALTTLAALVYSHMLNIKPMPKKAKSNASAATEKRRGAHRKGA